MGMHYQGGQNPSQLDEGALFSICQAVDHASSDCLVQAPVDPHRVKIFYPLADVTQVSPAQAVAEERQAAFSIDSNAGAGR